MVSILGVMAGFIAFENLVAICAFLIFMRYNIPVTILRYEGGKERPKMIQTKGRKYFRRGVPLLRVRGYNTPVRDYLSKNYYPTTKGKYGGLILWEFEDKLLTPAIPYKKGRDPEALKILHKATELLRETQAIPFEYDKKLHDQLVLKAVDDVDVEMGLMEDMRIDKQYAGGIWDFLAKYSGHIVIVMVGILLVVGWVIWLDKSPDMMAACAARAFDAAKESALQQLAAGAAPPG